MFAVNQYGWLTWAIVRAGQPRSALTQGDVMAILGYEPPVLALRNDGPERVMIFQDNALSLKWAFMLCDQLNGVAAQRQGAA